MKIKITPLGTISPYCKNDMNCPGFLIEYNTQKILLDAGNGITRNMKFPDMLENLHIFISHYHKDHFGDLGSIQYASYVYNKLGIIKEPINIYLPKEDNNFNKEAIIRNEETFGIYKEIDNNKKYKIDNMSISFLDSQSHTINSYMTKIENEEFKLVYTSDIGTSNIKDVVKFCDNADILICESSLIGKSTLNTHLTARQAGKLAKLANVKKLMLTHFWPEIDKKEYLLEAKEEFENTIVAIEGNTLSIDYNEKNIVEEER